MTTRKLLILRGLQASGKTTYAKQWIEEDPDNRIRFNRDNIRNMMGKYWLPKRENIITAMYYEFLRNTMLDGYDIVIDNMNLNPDCIKELEKEVSEFNEWALQSPLDIRYEIEVKDFFHVPLETCIKRDAERENPIGENVIRNTYNKYKDTITPWKYLI